VRNRASVEPAAKAADAMLDALCDLVIPATDTPGAVAVGTPAFVRLALEHSLGGEKSVDTLARVENELNERAGRPFLDLDPAARLTVLTEVDAAAYAQQPPASAWPTLKELILLGYYTSEIGGSQELRYELVPGRFDGNLPVEPQDRAFSSDWIAVS
jgi:glucoside 3-dehydrogenase (cytochrome c) hitch-hiker subunit